MATSQPETDTKQIQSDTSPIETDTAPIVREIKYFVRKDGPKLNIVGLERYEAKELAAAATRQPAKKYDKFILGCNGYHYPDDTEWWGFDLHDQEAVFRWLCEEYGPDMRKYAEFYMLMGGGRELEQRGACEMFISEIEYWIHFEDDRHQFFCTDDECHICARHAWWCNDTPKLYDEENCYLV